MIKLVNILSNVVSEQKRYKPDQELLNDINSFTELIYKKRKNNFKTYTKVGDLPITVADGIPGTVEIGIDPKLPYFGLLDQKVEDSKDPNDFIIKINPKAIKSKKNLYLTLYHEVMHATDPNFSTKSTEKYWEDYDSNVDEKYWSHPIEFRASTNEFIEGLMKEFILRKNRIKKIENIQSLTKAADNILDYFKSGKKLSKLSYNIIDSMSGEFAEDTRISKVLSDMQVDFPELSSLMPEKKELPYAIKTLELIKKYDPEIWKKFLSMIYSAIQEIKNLLNN
jgi:hypothetical protein